MVTAAKSVQAPNLASSMLKALRVAMVAYWCLLKCWFQTKWDNLLTIPVLLLVSQLPSHLHPFAHCSPMLSKVNLNPFSDNDWGNLNLFNGDQALSNLLYQRWGRIRLTTLFPKNKMSVSFWTNQKVSL